MGENLGNMIFAGLSSKLGLRNSENCTVRDTKREANDCRAGKDPSNTADAAHIKICNQTLAILPRV